MNLPRCPKGTRRNKKTGNCEKTGNRTTLRSKRPCKYGERLANGKCPPKPKRYDMITSPEELVINNVYRFKFRSDYDPHISNEYKKYIFKGYDKDPDNKKTFKFIPYKKNPFTKVLNAYKYDWDDYEYDDTGRMTSEYKFVALGIFDLKNKVFKTYSNKEIFKLDDWDEICFNIYNT
jgi:hypothetical protein